MEVCGGCVALGFCLQTKEYEWIANVGQLPALLFVVGVGKLATRHLKCCLVQAAFFHIMPFLLLLWRVSQMAGMLPVTQSVIAL